MNNNKLFKKIKNEALAFAAIEYVNGKEGLNFYGSSNFDDNLKKLLKQFEEVNSGVITSGDQVKNAKGAFLIAILQDGEEIGCAYVDDIEYFKPEDLTTPTGTPVERFKYNVCPHCDAMAKACEELEDDKEYNAELCREKDKIIADLEKKLKKAEQDRKDALSVYTKDGLLASEWIARAGAYKRELEHYKRIFDHLKEVFDDKSTQAG